MSKLLLNLGSGQRPFEKPWVNVDCQPRWDPDIVARAESMPMFEDRSAAMIVLHHVYEHNGCGEGLPILRECFRILEAGGRLIITVPNTRELVKAWIRGQLTDQVFFTNVYGAYMQDESDRHKWGYTPETLYREVAAACDWTRVTVFDFRPIPGADIARDFWITGVEATK